MLGRASLVRCMFIFAMKPLDGLRLHEAGKQRISFRSFLVILGSLNIPLSATDRVRLLLADVTENKRRFLVNDIKIFIKPDFPLTKWSQMPGWLIFWSHSLIGVFFFS